MPSQAGVDALKRLYLDKGHEEHVGCRPRIGKPAKSPMTARSQNACEAFPIDITAAFRDRRSKFEEEEVTVWTSSRLAILL